MFARINNVKPAVNLLKINIDFNKDLARHARITGDKSFGTSKRLINDAKISERLKQKISANRNLNKNETKQLLKVSNLHSKTVTLLDSIVPKGKFEKELDKLKKRV